jgi:hypothetical protein
MPRQSKLVVKQIETFPQMDVLGGGGLQLTQFEISHVGNIDVDISGLGPLGWILEVLVDFVDTFLKV